MIDGTVIEPIIVFLRCVISPYTAQLARLAQNLRYASCCVSLIIKDLQNSPSCAYSLYMQLKSKKARQKVAEAPDAQALWLTPRQLSKRWGVTDFTLRRWREQGKLKAQAFSTRTIRFSIFEVERFENSK